MKLLQPSPRWILTASVLGVCTLVPAWPLAAQDVRFGLAAYWPLDEISPDGLTTPDRSQTQTHLTLVGMGAANLVPGQRGNAMTFDGVSQLLYADTGGGVNPGLPLQNGVRKTIAMWVKADGPAQQDRRVFAEASMVSNAPMFNLGTDNAASGRTGKLDFYLRNDANAATVNHAKSTAEPFDNNWHHLAVTDDNGTVRVFVDGVQDATALAYTRPAMTLDTISIGGIRRMSGNLALFNGTVDDVAVWNRILSPAEIQQVMNDGLATPVPPLVAAVSPAPYRQGDYVQLSAEWRPGPSASVQWRRNGADIPGATEMTHTISALNPATEGDYSVVVDGTLVSNTLRLAFTADPVADVASGLVSWWPFEALDVNAFPPTTPDPWGGNPLSCTDIDTQALVPGKFGTAMEFDGISRLAYRTTGFPIASNPEYTVAFWVKADGTMQAADMRLFAEGSDQTNTPLFTMGTSSTATRQLRLYVRSDANAAPVALDSVSEPLDDTWHHVAWVDRNGEARLYVDGVMDPVNFRYNRAPHTFTLNQTALGGIRRAAPSHWSRSTMDDVAVWNRALSWTEIQSVMTNGVPAPVTAVPPEITVEPVPQTTLWQGRKLTVSVQVTGTGPFTYEWTKDGSPVSGTGPDLVRDPAAPEDAGTYICKVTNTAGSDTSTAATVTVRAITSLDSGRLNHWPLDTGTDTTEDILSGSHLGLTGFAEAAPFQAGLKNGAAYFDGTDDYLGLTRTGAGTDIPLTTREEYTVAFWVKADALGQLDRRVFSESSTSNTNPLFNLGTDNAGVTDKLEVFIRGDNGTVAVDHRATSAPVFDGFWRHVIYTDYRGQAQIYVDGVPDLSFAYTRPVSTFTTLSVGGIVRATPSYWIKGAVDDLNTWERALTADEASQYFQSQPVPEPVLKITNLLVPEPGHLQLMVSTSYGGLVNYAVQTSPDMTPGSWTFSDQAFPGPVANGSLTIDIFQGEFAGKRFYRVLIPE